MGDNKVNLVLEHQEQVLTDNRKFIVEHLDADDVMDELIQARMIGDNAAQRLQLRGTSEAEKNRIIVHQITTSGPGALEKFCDILKKKKRQTFIAEQLEKCLHSVTAESTSEPGSVVKSCPVDVKRLKARYLRLLPTSKTDWPKHKVSQFVRLALVEKDNVTLKDEHLNEVTELTIQGDVVDRIMKKKRLLGSLEDIFHFKNGPCPRLILIMGGPGIGKTTLAHEICVKWSRDGFLSEDFDAILLVPLRCVQQRSLEEVVIEYIEEDAYKQLKKSAGTRCLIILEGLDEMAIDRQNSDRFFIRLIKECTILEEATVLITSRPHACERLNVDRQVEIIGFGKDEIKEFVEKSFPNDEHSVGELLWQLNKYPYLRSLSYVPLNLVILVDIFQCNQRNLPSTLTDLYKLFIVMALQRQVMKKDEKCISLDVPAVAHDQDNLSKLLEGIPNEVTGTVFLLCKLSFYGIFGWHANSKEEDIQNNKNKWRDPKIIFTVEDLIHCGIQVSSQFDGCGLLKATHIHELPTDTSTYNFPHLTIQEFLASLYICLLPQQEQQHLITTAKYFKDFGNVFSFFCGLTKLSSNEMHQIVSSKLVPLKSNFGNPDAIPAMRCMYESGCFPQSIFALHIRKNGLSPYDYFCASYLLSSQLVSHLRMNNCLMKDKDIELLVKHRLSKRITDQSLEQISLTGNYLTAAGMVCVMELVQSSSATLKRLDISLNKIGDTGISVIAEGLQCNKTLKELILQNCKFSAKGASYLGELLKINNSLQELVMAENSIGNDGISSVAEGLQYNSTLLKMDIAICGISEKGASALNELLKVNNSLQELNMSFNYIGDEGISSIAEGLQSNKSLTKLEVDYCKFSSKGAVSISEALMINRSLVELGLPNNNISDDGIVAIAGALSESSITKLTIDSCNITFTGVKSLAVALLANQSIKTLMLWNNPITVDGAHLIMKAAVDNGVCQGVAITNQYCDEEVKKMTTILQDRKRQQTCSEGSNKNDNSSKECKSPEKVPQQEAGSMETKYITSIIRSENKEKFDNCSNEKEPEELPQQQPEASSLSLRNNDKEKSHIGTVSSEKSPEELLQQQSCKIKTKVTASRSGDKKKCCNIS